MDEQGRVYLSEDAPKEDVERLRRALRTDRMDLSDRMEELEARVRALESRSRPMADES